MNLDFDTWRKEKQIQKIANHRPTRTHSRLVAHPPTHVLYKGKIGVVVSYLWDFLWVVKVNGKTKTFHELDAQFLSKDWIYEQT